MILDTRTFSFWQWFFMLSQRRHRPADTFSFPTLKVSSYLGQISLFLLFSSAPVNAENQNIFDVPMHLVGRGFLLASTAARIAQTMAESAHPMPNHNEVLLHTAGQGVYCITHTPAHPHARTSAPVAHLRAPAHPQTRAPSHQP